MTQPQHLPILKVTHNFLRQPQSLILVAVIIIASFLRLYNIPGNVQFWGDQGRDALIVSQIFTEHDPVFIGPVTSVGNMYLGPFYYYFMLPFLWLSYPSPLGPVYAVALIGIITVALVYFLGKELIGDKAALIASFFYAVSATVAENVRFSWNPNIIPFFSLIMVWATYRAWKKDLKYWLLVTLCFSLLIQLHYITLLTAGGAGLILIWQVIQLIRRQDTLQLKKLGIICVGCVGIFLLSVVPLVLFDFKHNFLNLKSFFSLVENPDNFSQSQTYSPLSTVLGAIQESHGRSMHFLFEYMVGQHRQTNSFFVLTTFIILGWQLLRSSQKNRFKPGHIVIVLYLLIGIVGLSFYQHTVFNHYIAYLFPITALVYGIVLGGIWPKWWGKILLLAFGTYFLVYNFPRYQLQSLGWNLTDIRSTSEEIYQHLSPTEKYNLVLLSGTHDLYAQNYRYFLSTQPNKPLPPELSGQVDTLVIINEDHVTEMPQDADIYEIVIFPNKNPSEVFTIEQGPTITILRK